MVEHTNNERYKPLLLAFMGHMNCQQCDTKQIFSQYELLTIIPDEVARYMKFKAYGT